ncbi:MAG: putative Ig domain-containing protein [Acidobacteriia bacterium]|nr:putative Ig domain-containing protein [Terriglobia bacterium]
MTPPTLTTGIGNVYYSQYISGQGGSSPYTFTMINGSLPDGMHFSSGGRLYGTPTQAGNFQFTLQATDSSTPAYTGFQSFSLNISPYISISPTALPGATLLTPYSQTLTASGGTAPYTFAITSGALPPEISLSADGIISGIPTSSGSFNFTITATDSTLPNHSWQSVSYTYTAALSPPTVTAINPSSGTNNAPVSIASITGSNFALGWDKENGLVGNWRMDESSGSSVADSSGNNNTGIVTGTTISAGAKSGLSNARGFSGTLGDSVEIPDAPGLNVTGNFTVGFWINLSANANALWPQIFLKGDGVSRTPGIWLASTNYCGAVNKLYASFDATGGANQGTACPNTNLSLNTWYYITVVFEAPNLTMYVNGIQDVAATVINGTPVVNPASLHFGASPGMNAFSGVLDEVRFYNRALSPAEITQLMAAAGPGGVKLSKSGQSDIGGTGFTLSNSTQLSTGSLNISGAVPGQWDVVVTDPDGQSGTRAGGFTVNSPPPPNPVPSISSISPPSVSAGSATFTLTVNGSNFIGASMVQVNGNTRTTTFASSSQISAQIPSSDVTITGSLIITVFNPAPGGGTSNSATLTVTPPGGGLKGEYFNNMSLSGTPTLTRTDPAVNFNWGNGSPDPAIPNDNFSVRWSGQVQAQFSEAYTFYAITDDGVRLWVNGVLMIDEWIDQGPTAWSRSITLAANQKYNIIMEYYEHAGGASAQLSWMSPSTPYQIVPQSALTSTLGALVPGTGIGLTGKYFDNDYLVDPAVNVQVDPTINFNWGTGSPTYLPADHFSIRWTGQVEPQFSETYTFYAKTNDGPRLWVNGQQIINHWTSTTTQEWTGTITLTANQRYSIKLEYHETTGTAQAQLSWSSPSTPKQIIPQNRLYP